MVSESRLRSSLRYSTPPLLRLSSGLLDGCEHAAGDNEGSLGHPPWSNQPVRHLPVPGRLESCRDYQRLTL